MKQRAKLMTVGILLVGACGYGYWKYAKLQPTPAINNGVTDEFRRPSESQRKDFMEQAAVHADLSPEQVQKLEELRKQREAAGWERGPGRGFTSFSEVMTPEQREKMRDFFMSRRDATAKKAMSPQQYEAYKAKREQMRDRWRGPGGRGGQGGADRPAQPTT